MDILLMDVLKMINRITSGLTIESFNRKERDISTEKIQQKDNFAIQAAQVRLSAEASDKSFDPNYPLTKRGIEMEIQKGHPKEAAFALFLLNKLITHNDEEAEILFYSFGDWKNHMLFGLTPSEYEHEITMAGKEHDLEVYYENCIHYFKTVNTFYKIGLSIKKEITPENIDPVSLKKTLEVLLCDQIEIFENQSAPGLDYLRNIRPNRDYLSKYWPKVHVTTNVIAGIRKFKLTSVTGSNKWDDTIESGPKYPGFHDLDEIFHAIQFICYGIDGIKLVPKQSDIPTFTKDGLIDYIYNVIFEFIAGKTTRSLIDSLRKRVPLIKLEMTEQRSDYNEFLTLMESLKTVKLSADKIMNSIRDEIRMLCIDQPDLRELVQYLDENQDNFAVINNDEKTQIDPSKPSYDIVLAFMVKLSKLYKRVKNKGDSWAAMGFEKYLDTMVVQGVDALLKPLFTYLFRDETDTYGQEDFENKLNETLEKGASNLMASLNFVIQEAEKTPSERQFIEWYIKTIIAFQKSFSGLLEKYNIAQIMEINEKEIYAEMYTILTLFREQNYEKPFVEFVEQQTLGKVGKFLKHRVNYFSSIYQKTLGFVIYHRVQLIRQKVKEMKKK